MVMQESFVLATAAAGLRCLLCFGVHHAFCWVADLAMCSLVQAARGLLGKLPQFLGQFYGELGLGPGWWSVMHMIVFHVQQIVSGG